MKNFIIFGAHGSGALPKKGAWTDCRFKGEGLIKNEEVF